MRILWDKSLLDLYFLKIKSEEIKLPQMKNFLKAFELTVPYKA